MCSAWVQGSVRSSDGNVLYTYVQKAKLMSIPILPLCIKLNIIFQFLHDKQELTFTYENFFLYNHDISYTLEQYALNILTNWGYSLN